MPKILYISASPYSGSTLLSFLLNTHSELVSIGHATGWSFGEDEEFRCSCGELLNVCPFYKAIANSFQEQGLCFDVRNFGTAYRLAGNDRLNRVLSGRFPFLQNSMLERLRDTLVSHSPVSSSRLSRQDRANLALMTGALKHDRASVFVDNSHDPYRLRHLNRLQGFTIRNLHLMRDPRGVALSNKIHKNWDVGLSARLWLRRQADTVRIAKEFQGGMTVYYEDLCRNLDETLARIYQSLGVPPGYLPIDDFKATEHHILGNDMRLKPGDIAEDRRWREQLAPEEQDIVKYELQKFLRRVPDHTLSEIISHYI